MPRDYFKRSAQGDLLTSGTIITDIQASLNAVTAFAIQADGVFGKQTQDALVSYQTTNNLPVTGTVSDLTWVKLMRNAEPSVFERCLQVVASFEGTGFQIIEGNFDGAGLTWGIIGFTLFDGELGQVLADINQQQPAVFGEAFGDDAALILEMSGPAKTSAQRLAFADSITGPRFRVAEPWRTFFSDLGANREVQRIQIERARAKYWPIALRDAGELNMTEELDLMLMFDVAVQDGGMHSKDRMQTALDRISADMGATQRRQTVAKVVADSIRGAFASDVLARKTCIANGAGTVHGSHYALDSWGLVDGATPTLFT